MKKFSTMAVASISGLIGLLVGLVAFTVNWIAYGGGMPGYNALLLPGNMSLIYIWHPIFTEEIDFWPKLVLQSFGQFGIVAVVAGGGTKLTRWALQLRAQ